MTRGVVLGTLVALGALSLAVSGQAPPAGPTAKAIAATKIEKVKDNLYIVTGSGIEDTSAFSGGNTAVLITDVLDVHWIVRRNLMNQEGCRTTPHDCRH